MGRLRHLLVGLGLTGSVFLTAGTVSYYEEALPSTMNPLFARSMVDHRTHELVFDRLFFRSAITNELKSRLVDNYSVVEGGKKLKVVLKQGIKWHDGKPLTGEDVCFTIDAMLDPKTASPIAKQYKEALEGCEHNEKENSATIAFKRLYHNPRERVGFSVLPAHMFQGTAVSPDMDFSQRPIGTGPMKGSKGRRAVSFTKFANGHHDPKIGNLSQQEGGDPNGQIRTLINGGVQGVIAVPPSYRPDVAASDDVALKSYDLRSWWFVAVNTNKGPLKDKRVRQALDLTLDREALRELTIGVDKEDAHPPCEFVSGPFVQSSPYYNRQVRVHDRSDLAKAKQLMTAAGFTSQADRWLINGQAISFRIGMNSSLNAEAIDLLNQVNNQLDRKSVV